MASIWQATGAVLRSLSSPAKFLTYITVLIVLAFFGLLVAHPNGLSIMESTSRIKMGGGPIIPPKGISTCSKLEFLPRTTHEEAMSEIAWQRAVDTVTQRQLTFLKEQTLRFHQIKLREIETNGIAGMIIECGVAKAGSAITFAAYKHKDRCLHLFDTFEGIPEPSTRDGADVLQRYEEIQNDKRKCQKGLDSCKKNYYGNMNDLLDYDISEFENAGYNPTNHSVYFHKGLFDDTVWPVGPIAYAHLDGDWYDSTFNMLKRLVPHLSTGGYIVLDDVYHWSGARDAFLDYFGVAKIWLIENATTVACWSGVDVNDGTTRYFRLAREHRANAQALPDMPATDHLLPTCPGNTPS